MKYLLALIVLVASSCVAVSETTREYTLEPATVQAWTGVRADVERGITAAVEAGDLADRSIMQAFVEQMQIALDQGAKQSSLQVIPWGNLHDYGLRGIQDRVDDGEIHELVAESFRERLRLFDRAVGMLVGRPISKKTYGKKTFLPDGSMLSGSTLVTANGQVHTISPRSY